jgi:hypothetical protein
VYESLEQEGWPSPPGRATGRGAGLTLGGGLGILGRNYGVTSDHLLAAQIVLADGRVLDCLGARLALGAAGKVDRVVNLSGDQHQMDAFIWANFPLSRYRSGL